MGRFRRFATSADRQRAYRLRKRSEAAWRRGDAVEWRRCVSELKGLEVSRSKRHHRLWFERVTSA